MKNKLKKDIIPTCKIHTMDEKTLGGGPKGGVENKNYEWESESHSIPWVSGKSRYDRLLYTSQKLKRR